MRLRFTRRTALLSLAILAPSFAAGAQATPKSGVDVLQIMHDAYAGKWYRTLTFTQKPPRIARHSDNVAVVRDAAARGRDGDAASHRRRRPKGRQRNALHRRFDVGDARGKLTATRPTGNEFLPMIEGVYMQPVAKTLAQLKSTRRHEQSNNEQIRRPSRLDCRCCDAADSRHRNSGTRSAKSSPHDHGNGAPAR